LSNGPGTELGMIYCGRCEYPLVGVSAEGKCPECGEPVAGAVSAAAVLERDTQGVKWMRAGLNLMLAVFGLELVWAVVYVVLLLRESFAVHPMGWESGEGNILLVNGAMLVLLPSLMLSAVYVLIYGMTRSDRRGWGVWWRSVLIVLFVNYLLSTASAWVALAFPERFLLYELGYRLSALVRVPVVLVLIMGLGVGLLLSAVGEAQRRLNVQTRVWGKRGAYGALGMIVGLTLVAHGIGWYANAMVPTQGASSLFSPPAAELTPAWSVWDRRNVATVMSSGGVMVVVGEAEQSRRVNIESICNSDCGFPGPLRWVNVVTWWGINHFGPAGVLWSEAYRLETTHALSAGLVDARVGESPSIFVRAGLPVLLLWPEVLWGGMGLLASGYLWGYLLVQGVKVRRALPREG
jgi:hypothetical protein